MVFNQYNNVTTARQLLHLIMRESDPQLTHETIDFRSAPEASIENPKKKLLVDNLSGIL